MPAGVHLAAYRVVQEALTNVLKHANASSVDVTVDYCDDALTLHIVDDGRGTPAAAGSASTSPNRVDEGGTRG